MPKVTANCVSCGDYFEGYSRAGRPGPRYCSQQCWLRQHNNPERNAKVARDTVQQRADMLRDRGAGLTYRKRDGRHEHIGVMETKLGRKLLPSEIVHHNDENKRNNDPDNLALTNRPDHARHHNLGKRKHFDPYICYGCKQSFTASPSQRSRAKYGERIYCTRSCYDQHRPKIY